MPEWYKLDKNIAEGTTYQTPPDRFYVIEKVGTDSVGDIKLLVDGAPVLHITYDLASRYVGGGNLFGPIDLGENYVVIPPNTKFWVEGTGSSHLRIIGKIGRLLPGEGLPADLKARYDAQTKKFITFVSGSYTFAAGASWPAGQEITLVELTPKTIEKYKLDDRIGVSVSGLSAALAAGQVGIRFYLDGKPLDMLTQEPGPYGLDAYGMPLPPTTSTPREPYTLKDIPIEVLGDHTLKITAINISGGALAAASTTTSIVVTLKAIAKYERTS